MWKNFFLGWFCLHRIEIFLKNYGEIGSNQGIPKEKTRQRVNDLMGLLGSCESFFEIDFFSLLMEKLTFYYLKPKSFLLKMLGLSYHLGL